MIFMHYLWGEDGPKWIIPVETERDNPVIPVRDFQKINSATP
jgi:hypothetical protein